MFKATPNPPETDDVSPYESLDSKKLNEAANRALDHYLNPSALKSPVGPQAEHDVYRCAGYQRRRPVGPHLRIVGPHLRIVGPGQCDGE